MKKRNNWFIRSLKSLRLGLFEDAIAVKIKIPYWLIGIIILLPLIAYFDVTVMGKTTFWSYLGISAIELFLMYLGFLVASNIKEIKLRR